MGLFGFIGKAVKGIAGFVPGLSQVVKVAEMAGTLLSHKGGGSAGKIATMQRVGPLVSRGNSTQSGGGSAFAQYHGRSIMTAQQLRSSPVMPGGAVATARGPLPKQARPPASFGGARSLVKRSRAKRAAKRGAKRAGKARRLKFGSPAWRKKYVKKRR